ncbi:glycosyltransferase family 2 protein [Desulfogranum mediterraneum]|uniref:glycosyltransferase family 2 protein n=1 Tax=Desulfogranum mediterraneum TaxID=160661 RepID=UPI0003F5CFCA|nr:glycosyltransferase [Desulfogranum mediterraneum]
MKIFSSADVTIAVLNYNGLDKIPDLFASIKELEQEVAEVIMVDDGSTDGSPEWVRANHPQVRLVLLPENSGGMLNLVRNRALAAARTDLVFIVDNDVVLSPDCVEAALLGMNTLPGATVCTTRAVYEEKPNLIYQDGQLLHYIGASPNINRDRELTEVDQEPRLSIGWGVQLINKVKTAEFGWFNEAYSLGWGDDGEFNHKLNMAGCNCYHIPASVVLHKRHSASKRYVSAVRNRWRFILEMYQWKTILLISPALLFYEFPLFGFLLLQRRPRDYFRGMASVFSQLPSIFKERRKIQARRTVPDRQLMGCGDIFVYSDEMSSPLLRMGYKFLNNALFFYWRIIRNAL